MSHNVSLNGIKFKNLSVLQCAVEEMQREGINMQFVSERTEIRGWQGKREMVDCAIKFPAYNYDVGFKYNQADQSYTPVVENLFRLDGVTASPGSVNVEGAACNPYSRDGNAIIGRLAQRYAIINTERNAAMSGMRTTRVNEEKTGLMHLDVHH